MKLVVFVLSSAVAAWGCKCLPAVDRCGAASSTYPVFAGVVEAASPTVDWGALDADEEPSDITVARTLLLRSMSNLAPEHETAVRAAATIAELRSVIERISDRGIRYSVRVVDAFGSKVPERQEVWSDFTSCGLKLEIGRAYLFRGSMEDARYRIRLCGRGAVPLEDAGRDLAFLLLQKPHSGAISRLAGAVSANASDLSRSFQHASAPLKDVSVVVRRNDDVRQTEVDKMGEFLLDGLAPGRYQAEVISNRSGKAMGPSVPVDIPARGCAIKFLIVDPKDEDEEP